MAKDKHYLEQELYDLTASTKEVLNFIESCSLDGMWYWDLENPDHEWMSSRFWTTFGFEPTNKKHLASEWQDLIFQEDLETATENFERHCADPSYPYDQIVRYRHRDGSTVWVRCRGMVIRNDDGDPVRMLGAHTDISEAMVAKKSCL